MTTACVHRWQIATANGPQSSGTCAHCGEVRSFFNSMQEEELKFMRWKPHLAKQEVNDMFVPWGDTTHWREV